METISVGDHWFPPLYVILNSWTIGTIDLYVMWMYGNCMVFWDAILTVTYATVLYI